MSEIIVHRSELLPRLLERFACNINKYSWCFPLNKTNITVYYRHQANEYSIILSALVKLFRNFVFMITTDHLFFGFNRGTFNLHSGLVKGRARVMACPPRFICVSWFMAENISLVATCNYYKFSSGPFHCGFFVL